MYVCVCCVCEKTGSDIERFYMYIYIYIIKTHVVHIFYYDPFKFPDECFDFRLELLDEFTEIFLSSFRPFIQKAFQNIVKINSINI